MPLWSRRRVLQAVTATATVGLAGCSASTERSDEVPSRHDGDPVTGYDAETVRDPGGRALFWRATDGDQRPQRERNTMELLTDPLSESDVTLAADVPAADGLRAFLGDTDFEARSVLLFATPLSGCETLRIQGVSREAESTDGDLDVSLCRATRPADVACDADADHTAGVAVRLPFPAEDVNSFGMGLSSDCRPEAEPVTLDGGDGS